MENLVITEYQIECSLTEISDSMRHFKSLTAFSQVHPSTFAHNKKKVGQEKKVTIAIASWSKQTDRQTVSVLIFANRHCIFCSEIELSAKPFRCFW